VRPVTTGMCDEDGTVLGSRSSSRSVVGLVVSPTRQSASACTRDMYLSAGRSMKRRTYGRCSQIVSTVKKSTASRLRRCVRRDPHQLIPPRLPAGQGPAPRSQLRIVVAETARPRSFSSPAIHDDAEAFQLADDALILS